LLSLFTSVPSRSTLSPRAPPWRALRFSLEVQHFFLRLKRVPRFSSVPLSNPFLPCPSSFSGKPSGGCRLSWPPDGAREGPSSILGDGLVSFPSHQSTDPDWRYPLRSQTCLAGGGGLYSACPLVPLAASHLFPSQSFPFLAYHPPLLSVNDFKLTPGLRVPSFQIP